jgi:hypothetical protein
MQDPNRLKLLEYGGVKALISRLKTNTDVCSSCVCASVNSIRPLLPDLWCLIDGRMDAAVSGLLPLWNVGQSVLWQSYVSALCDSEQRRGEAVDAPKDDLCHFALCLLL